MGTFGLWGAVTFSASGRSKNPLGEVVTLLPENKITQCAKANSNRSKNKSILTSNQTIIISKIQWNPDFSNLKGKENWLENQSLIS